MTNNHKTHLRMKTEVLRLYQSGVEMQGMEHYGCMTTKTRFEKWGGNPTTECMSQNTAHGDV